MHKGKSSAPAQTTAKAPNILEQSERLTHIRKQFDSIQQNCKIVSDQILNALISNNSVKLSNKHVMGLYNQIYNLTEEASNVATFDGKSKDSGQVENDLLNLYRSLLIGAISTMFDHLIQCHEQQDQVLQQFNESYHNYKAYSYWLIKIFYYLDKFTTFSKGTNLSSISLQLFKENYFEKLKPILFRTSYHFIQQQREYNTKMPKQLRNLIQLFEICGQIRVDLKYSLDIGVYNYQNDPKQDHNKKYYQDHFQRELLSESELYYRSEILVRKELQTPEFVSWALLLIAREEEMAVQFYPYSEQPIKNKIEMLFIKDLSQQLVDSPSGVQHMLSTDSLHDLEQLFVFISRVNDCVKHIAIAYRNYFEQLGNIINQSETEPKEQGRPITPMDQADAYFNKVLTLMDRAQGIQRQQLKDNMEIQKAFNVAFGTFLNKNDKTPLWLAIFADLIIKTDKGMNQMDIHSKLNKVLRLFQLIYHRDVFFKHYQKILSIRLLNPNYNLDVEKQIIQKFKGETGTNALSTLSMMINDIEQSQRNAADFKIRDWQRYDFTVSLLSQGCWPLPALVENVKGYSTMQNSLNQYEVEYIKRHSGRQIIWSYGQGVGEIVLKTKTEKYFFQANTLQMIAFLQFNSNDSLSVRQLIETINITKVDLENSLIPFVCLKILKRSKADLEEFDDEEYLTLISEYQNKQKKLKVLPNLKMQPKRIVAKQELGQEEIQMMEQLQKQREFVVDSQLVRIMKSRKTIKHNVLVEDCMRMITIFRPDVTFIKKRIENLIEREYIKRDDSDWYQLL